jgi:hypothetical protein
MPMGVSALTDRFSSCAVRRVSGARPAADAAMHQQAQQHAQCQQRGQQVGHQFAGNALLHRRALAHLHAQGLRRVGVAVLHIQRHDAQRFARPALACTAAARPAAPVRRVGWGSPWLPSRN